MREKNVKHRPKYLLAVIFVTVLVMVMGLSGIASAADSGLNDVDKPTLKELRDKYNEVGNPPKGAATFSTPVDTVNYTPATLSDDAYDYAEKYINFMRFQAGIAPIKLTEELNNNAAQGALIMARNKVFNHKQAVPSGITEQAAKPGRYATMASNISYMISTSINGMSIVETAILGQMKDDRRSNLESVGHRRWLMKPSTSTMGIGSALIDDDGWKTSYSAIRVMNRTYNEPLYDSSFGNIAENNSVNYDFVAWPSSGYMLNTVFDYNTPWSVSINEDKYKQFSDNVEVEVKRLSDNKIWKMNNASANSLDSSGYMQSNYFKISNNSNLGYTGEGHCLIFCPNPNELGSSKLNDSFEVTITGLEKKNGDAATLRYAVDFKGLKPSMNEMDITLESGSLEYTGQALKPKAIVSYDGTTLVEDEDYSIEYTNNVGVGNAAVAKIKGKGDYEGEVTKTFAITPKKVSLPIAKTGLVYSGAEQIGVSDSQEYTVANGSAENAGQYTATVSLKDKTNTVWIDESTTDKSIVWSISPKSLADATVELEEDEFEYDGSEKKPVATVKDEEKTLTEGTDYSVGYSDNVYVGNQAKVIVSAKEGGNYSGSVTKTFTIAPKTLTADMISITSDPAVYDGTDHTPAFKVMDGETELVKDTDYEVESDGKGKAAGNYDIKIKGKGNYSGNATKAFTISKKPLSGTMVKLNNNEFTYNGQEQKPTVTVVDGELMTADDYQITYNGGTNAGDYKVTVSEKDKGNYSGSVEKSFKINPKDIADESVKVTVAGGSTYNGSGQEPDVTVKDGDNSLTNNDFEVAYNENVNAGENAEATITGKGNYKGSRTQTFSIARASLTGATIVLKPIGDESIEMGDTTVYVQETENAEIKPEIDSVTLGDVELTADDYEAAYSNNTAPGKEAKVTITGIGNYNGTAEVTFTIVSKAEFEIEEKINKLNGELDALNQAAETAKTNYTNAESIAKASKAAADSASANPGQAAVNAAQKAADDAAAAAEAAKAVENALEKLQSKIEEIQQTITEAEGKVVVLKDKIEQYAGEIQGLFEKTAGERATAKQNTEKAEQAKTSASNALEQAKSDKAEADKKAAEGTTPGQNGNTNLDDPKTGNTDKGAGEKADADDDDDDEDAATIAKINAAKAAKVKIKGKALKKLKVQLTWKKVKNVSGFEVYQSAKKKGKFKKLATIKKGTAVKWKSKKIKKGKKGKKVFFKVRAFTIVDGDKVYGKWSNVKAIKLKK